MRLLLLGALGALMAVGILAAFGGDGQPTDTMRDPALENTMLLCQVPDSIIGELMLMRKKQFIVDGEPVDGEYFYVDPSRRRGWVVTIDKHCIVDVQKVFDLDERAKR
jgi:hypothetical protein